MMYDAEYLNEHADLKAVYEYVTGHTLRRHSDQWEGSCPFCSDSKDSFRIPDKIPHRWFCRKCKEKGGTALDLVLSTKSGFREACEELARIMNITEDEAQYKGIRRDPAVQIPKDRYTDFCALPEEPSDRWQAEVIEAVNHAHDFLMSDAGRKEREYLYRRGFSESTLRENRIGFNPTAYPMNVTDDEGRPVKASVGIYIPTFVKLMDGEPYESLLRVKVRAEDWYYRSLQKAYDEGRIDYTPLKYWHIKGGISKSLFCADYARNIDTNENIIFTEGEFDAMSINQVAGDICHAVTFGSHSNVGRTADYWHAWFCAPSQTIVCFDNESDPVKAQAVRKHEDDLRNEITRAQALDDEQYRAEIPIIRHLPEQYHDWNDILQMENGEQIIRDILTEMFGL